MGGMDHRRTGSTARTLTVLCALFSVVAIVATACSSAREAPPILLPTNAEPSTIYDANGTLITTLQEENRSVVSLDQIPRTVQDAVIAIEDDQFWHHNGINPRSIARAARSNAASGEITQGGSTITQQYVKNALLSDEQTIGRKLEEASLAMALERNYSKELILELYLNTIYLGAGAYGVDAAARTYFGVPVSDVTLPQAALLAGVIQSPARHDPRRHPDSALKRRNLVLSEMLEQGMITKAQYTEARATPIVLAEETPLPEQLPYPAPHFVDEVKNWLLNQSDTLGKNRGERRERLLRGGLKIYTTVDLTMQQEAEDAIRSVFKAQGTDPKDPDAALVSIDPKSGFVKAMVGGFNYFGTHAYRQANLAMGTGRSTGSAFKPIVMAAALEAGVSPSKVFNSPSSTQFKVPGGIWKVKGGGGLGAGTMHECLVVSSNTCFANIILDKQVGAERADDMAKRLGIVSTKLSVSPAMVLGPNNTTVLDVASVYATFANDGVHVPPAFVTKIVGPDGEVIYQHAHSQSKAIEPEIARQVTSAMEGVIAGGTGKSAAIDRPAAGKTGSAQRHTDAWFTGFTPQLATAVWVGFAETRADRSGTKRLVSMTSPNTRITVFGGTYPAKIWSTFMKSALAESPVLPLISADDVPIPTTTVPSPNATVTDAVKATEMALVPNVVGASPESARKKLTGEGFKVRELRNEVVDLASSTVTAQSPSSGSSLPKGTEVWIQFPVPPPPPTTTTTSTSTVPGAATTSTTTTKPKG